MARVRAALYLDFDNVFSGLIKQDPDVAIQFAKDPAAWLVRLTTALTVDGPRRWLILRCYMNPGGWVPNPDTDATQQRLYYSQFRPFFVNAGFEVIDCPRLTHTKNAADIRMVVDAVDALADPVPYEEFVIGSGDSDMTPLLVRLRRADRRTTIVSPSDAAEAFTAVADRLITSQELLELVQGEPVESDEAAVTPVDPETPVSYEQFRDLVSWRYTAATGPLNLASLAHDLRRQLGPSVDETNWFGNGGFVRALESLSLPNAKFSNHFVWDAARHEAPESGVATGPAPEPVGRLSALLSLPRLAKEMWPPVYQALADYAAGHHFNLTEATRWARDQLAAQGVDVSRSAIAFVTRGTAFGGAPLYRQPPPNAAEIASAFADNVLNRAEAATIALSEEEIAEVRAWLGAS
ncbi:NYN domain-containing protein [Actinoplanes teichomyceticus]|uniref:NYN domain-containing protein n=1 Tax=Actinoplanes teichomyceticus TaxID=1867 RepID=A0A561WJQ6_ACTTI|nr:NYN domain-containing protein [Actinoplanes teichomyceticus]TWG24085.1 NYN domain-containing protein [Actinoplanes teichomyceticus]GIF12125.1 NYN domain-containing protein [Actinoplanes teichomyceticus]